MEDSLQLLINSGGNRNSHCHVLNTAVQNRRRLIFYFSPFIGFYLCSIAVLMSYEKVYFSVSMFCCSTQKKKKKEQHVKRRIKFLLADPGHKDGERFI